MLSLPTLSVVKTLVSNRRNANFLVISVPFSSRVLEATLEESGVLGDVILRELSLGFLGLEDDLLTMDWSGALRELWREKDESCVLACIQGLLALEPLAQVEFEVLRSIGRCADTVTSSMYSKLMDRRRRRAEEQREVNSELPLDVFRSEDEIDYARFVHKDERSLKTSQDVRILPLLLSLFPRPFGPTVGLILF